MDGSKIVHQTEASKPAKVTSWDKATPKSFSSVATGSSDPTGNSGFLSSVHQGPSASKPAEVMVQGRNGINGACTAKSQGHKGGFFIRWFLKPAKKAASCLRLRLGKREKCPIDSSQPSERQPLSFRFYTLPIELQLEIIDNLTLNDIIRLRQTSRAFSHLIQNHEGHIVKQYIRRRMPKYISILFPLPTAEAQTLKFLKDVTYRREASDHLADLLARRIVKEMGRGNRMRAEPIQPSVIEYVVEQLKIGFSPLILAVFHFLETYHVRKAQEITGTESSTREERAQKIQSDIMLQYPDWLLLKVHQMYHLLLHLFTRRMKQRPFFFFRSMNRWNHTPPGTKRPSDPSLAKILLFGGIPEVLRIYKIKGVSQRNKSMDKYLRRLDSNNNTDLSMNHHGGLVKGGMSIDADELGQIWVPAAEKQILSRGIVPNLESIRCCGEFVAELLGDEFNTENGSVFSQDENAEDRAGNAQMLSAMQWTSVNLRNLADDGSWDRNLIAEEEDDDYVEEKEKEGHGVKRSQTPPSKPVAGPSRSPGTIVGMTAPVPMASGIGYNGMGANFMSMGM